MVFGEITDEYIAEIKSYLDSEELFIAEQLNIPTLYAQLWKFSNGQTSADHAFHEFSSLRPATEQEIESLELWGNTSDLIDNFRNANRHSWDCSQSVHCALT